MLWIINEPANHIDCAGRSNFSRAADGCNPEENTESRTLWPVAQISQLYELFGVRFQSLRHRNPEIDFFSPGVCRSLQWQLLPDGLCRCRLIEFCRRLHFTGSYGYSFHIAHFVRGTEQSILRSETGGRARRARRGQDLVNFLPEIGERSLLLSSLEAGVLPKRPMWSAGVGLRRRTTLAVRAAMDGSPSEALAIPQPEIDLHSQK